MANINLEFRVLKEGSRFIIRDQNDLSYGWYDNKKDAEQCAQDWFNYYKESS